MAAKAEVVRGSKSRPAGAPPLTTAERDRRYKALRERFRERSLDGVVVTGSNLFYLTNKLPGEYIGLFPTDEDVAFTAFLGWRYLVDIPAQMVIDSQDWVSDIRNGRDAGPVAERIKELRLEGGTIGFAGPLSHQMHAQFISALPSMTFVDVSDIFTDVRTIKSAAEIALLDQAHWVFDAAVDRIQEFARPGMLGSEVVAEGRKTMWDFGGDLDSDIMFNFGPDPAQNPALAAICLDRPILDGDIGTLTGHCHYRHYAGHTDQEFVFGEPKPRHLEMFEAIRQVHVAVLEGVKEGAIQRHLFDVYEKKCGETGFDISPHAQIHLFGIDVPEFPGPSFKLENPAGGVELGGAGNFVLKSGMIYSISPTLIDKATGDLLLGGAALAVTEDGYRPLGSGREVEMLVCA